jgi:hypothetical protein
MGDKTQLATIALGARFEVAGLVTVGTTLGMLAADGLVVFGEPVSPGWCRARSPDGEATLSTPIHRISRIPSLPTCWG